MTQPDLFDVVELLVDLPSYHLQAGTRGAIVEAYGDRAYEVEFADQQGETLALCTLSAEQFVVVWKSKTQSWLSISEQLVDVIGSLPEERKQQVLDFARSLYQR